MHELSPAEAAHLAQRAGRLAHVLVWITARNRATGAQESLGLWSGDDHQDVIIDGVTRTYYGAGGLLDIDQITAKVGLEVRMLQLRMTPTTEEVALLLRGYDARLAPVEIHRALFDPETMALIAPPRRRWKGWADEVSITLGPEDDNGLAEGVAVVSIASNARAGTRGLTLKQSDESQKLRGLPGGGADRFYKYTDVSGAVKVKWGE